MKQYFILIIFLLSLFSVSAIEVNHQEIVNEHAVNSSGENNANINANITNPQIFELKPPVNETWYITRLFFEIEDNAVFTASNYGGISLTDGYYIRTNISNNLNTITPDNITSLVDISHFSYDLSLQEFGSGNNFAQVRWTFTRAGTHIKLNGSNFDSIQIVLQDDFSNLVGHSFVFQGFKLNNSRIDVVESSTMASTDFNIIFFLALFNVLLFVVPLILKKTIKTDYLKIIIPNCVLILAFYVTTLNFAILATLSSGGNLGITKEMFFYMEVMGWAGYVAMIFTAWATIVSMIKQWEYNANKKRMGGEL